MSFNKFGIEENVQESEYDFIDRMSNKFHSNRSLYSLSLDPLDFQRLFKMAERNLGIKFNNLEVKKDTMTLEEFLEKSKSGKIFTITFIKRSTGKERVMNCRRGVSKDIKGTGMSYDPTKKDLLVVWDMQKQAYRMINLDNLISLVLNGRYYLWNNETKEFIMEKT